MSINLQNIDKKKFAIGAILIIVFAFALFQVYELGKPQKGGPSPLPRPDISNTYLDQENLKFEWEISEFETPETLPTIDVSFDKSMSEEEVMGVATKMGFGNNYVTFTNGEGNKIYFFTQNASTLSVNSTGSSLSYRAPYRENVQDAKVSDEDLRRVASEFLADKVGLPGSSLNLSFITYYKFGFENTFEITERGRAEIFRVNFSPISSDYKLLTIDPDRSPVSVIVSKDGVVAKADIMLSLKATKSTEEYPIKNFEEIKATIDQAKTIQAQDYYLLNNYRNVSINTIELAYLAEKSVTPKYQPIFILTGTVVTPEKIDPEVILYLPAIR